MADEKLDADFANLPPPAPAEVEGRFGIGLHHAPAAEDDQVTGEAFHHPEQDGGGTIWSPYWEPIETSRDGEVVMFAGGSRKLLGRCEIAMWMELIDGDETAQPDYHLILWSYAPDQVKYDMM